MQKVHFAASLLVMLLGLSACATTFSSREYAPDTPERQAIYKKARKDVYPKQVRQNAARYADDTIAWAGIVKSTELFQSPYGPAVRVLIEHRYFDWIEDHGAQPERFFLSPRGEGDFLIIVKPDAGMDQKAIDRLVPPGTMAIAVGSPYVKAAEFKDKPLALLTDYFQFIEQKWYRTDVFDYGREGESIKRVEGGDFWGSYGPR